MEDFRLNTKGRGARENTPNRFDKTHLRIETDGWEGTWQEEDKPLLRTEFFVDSSRTIVAENDSPDVGFRFSINPYRGCEHGCAYCYARPTHEYLGLSAGLDFESKIFVKLSAPELLREKLSGKSWRPATIAMSGVTDCYQPAEKHFQLTRQCLEVLREFRNPVGIVTKNYLVTRDIDVLRDMAKLGLAAVFVSVTTLRDDLAAQLEPRTSRPNARLKAITELAAQGIPVGAMVAPVIPGLNDFEIPKILQAVKDAGAERAGFVPLRLPLNVLPIFTHWLGTHYPERKEKVLQMIREVRSGKLNDARFGSRMRGEGPVADTIRQMFDIYCHRLNLNKTNLELSTGHFRRPTDQLALF